jgi:DNA-binding transcriptional regulator YiaG
MTAREIFRLRKEIGVSQRKFAGLLGVSLRTAQGWEKGIAPSAATMKLLRMAATLFDSCRPFRK